MEFALNQTRASICILVGVMPPEEISTEIALRLNNQSSTAMAAGSSRVMGGIRPSGYGKCPFERGSKRYDCV